MNYIKQLESDRAENHERDVKNAQIIAELRRYLESDKFRSDPYVNVNDIFLRLEGLNFQASPIEIYGPVCEKCHRHTYNGTTVHESC